MFNLLKMEVDLNQIKNNILNIQKQTNKKLIPVIKSNAYNLGALEIMKLIDSLGLDYAAVVDMTEALELLSENFKYRILILNSLNENEYKYLNEFPNLGISINNLKDLNNLEKININRKIKVHLQVDSGMNRLGFKNVLDFRTALEKLKQNNSYIIEGIYTHFSSLKAAKDQLELFKKFKSFYDFKMVHVASTSTYLEIDFGNYVRVGLDIYGTHNYNQSLKISCKPLEIQKVSKGQTIGYDEDYLVKEDSLIAILPIGYANGFKRSLKGYNLIAKNKKYKTIGLVCMNHIFVEVDYDIDLNTEFIITNKEYPLELIAKYLSTSSYEVLCMFNIRNLIYNR